MGAFIFGVIGGLIVLFILKGKKRKPAYIPIQTDRNSHNRFKQKREDARIYQEYCHYRESIEKEIEEVNKYKDLDKDKWWYFFGMGVINISWARSEPFLCYDVYDEESAKYLGDTWKKMEAEYDAAHTPIAELPKMFIPSMI